MGVFSITLGACSDQTPEQKSDQHQAAASNMATSQLETLAAKIDARISNMKILAKTIANDQHLHAWVAQGFSSQGEALLIEKLGFLVNEYQLTSASFADKNTHKYWNHEGFLRVLDPAIDTWYFAYTNTQEQDLISVYHDKNKHRVDLYVNYQQLDGQGTGHGLSGIATSFDGVLDMMLQSVLSESGVLLIVDSKGTVQVHPDAEVAGIKKLADLFDETVSEMLLAAENRALPQRLYYVEPNTVQSKSIVSVYMPSMNSYLVLLQN